MSDVTEIKERAGRVAHHFASYVSGAGFDAKRLAGDDVPALIVENERLRETVASLQDRTDRDYGAYMEVISRCEGKEHEQADEIASLRATITRVEVLLSELERLGPGTTVIFGKSGEMKAEDIARVIRGDIAATFRGELRRALGSSATVL